MIGAGDARNGDGSRASLYVELHQPYLHGTYRREDVYGRRTEPLVALGRGHDVEPPVYLSPGEGASAGRRPAARGRG